MSTVNLGQISAFFSGTSEPINTSLVWQDTSTSPAIHKVFDSTTSTWRFLGDFTLDIRTITINGVTDRISVVGGTQELGNNGVWTVNLATTYVGQTSINTLGTITTGAWEGSVIDEVYLDTSLVRNNGPVILSGDLTVTGDFIVNGTNTAINVTNLTTEDPLIHGASVNPNDTLDLGVYWSYDVSTTETFTGIFRDTSDTDKSWTFFDSLTEQPTTTVNTAGVGYALGAIKVAKVSSTSVLDINSVFINIDSSDVLNINSGSNINLQANGVTKAIISEDLFNIITDLSVNGSIDLGSGFSGNYPVELVAENIIDGESRYFFAGAIHNSNQRFSEIGVYTHVGITNACSYILLNSESGNLQYIWVDNVGQVRISQTQADIGTVNGFVIGTQTSDERIKNIKEGPFSYGLNEILQLSDAVIEYSLKQDVGNIKRLGFSAQKTRELIPEMVFESKENWVINGELIENILGLNIDTIIPVLVKSIEELHSMVQLQKEEIELLKLN